MKNKELQDLQELMALNDWDKAIMKKYPFVYVIKSTKYVYEAIDNLTNLFEEGTISWKGPKFFFANEDDRTKFHNMWNILVFKSESDKTNKELGI